MTSTAATEAPAARAAHPPRAALRGDIEGLRAIAVLMVLLYHAGVPGLSGGFAGVDVFFVISGYLITSQLVKEATATGHVSLPKFYARRARRLLPAATLVLLVTAVAGWLVLPPSRHATLGADVVGATMYVVNWLLAFRQVDYLAEDADPSLLQHYWSLSVEEQFYVVWPLLILLVLWLTRRLRLRLRRVLTVALVLVVAASFAWSVVSTASSPGIAYFATTTRIWELGIGALLVLLTPWLLRLPSLVATLLTWAGLVMIGATLVSISTQTPWPGSAAALPVLGTAAVIAAGIASPDILPARLLGVRPMRFFGALSYSLYLWHWPALQLLEAARPGSGLKARLAVAALSVVLAWLSLRLVENPIRFHPLLARSTRRALFYGATSMVASAAAGAALILSAPRLDTADLEAVAADAGAIGLVADPTSEKLSLIPDPERLFTTTGPITPDPALATKDTASAAYGAGCQVRAGDPELPDEDACFFGDLEGDVDVALVGDSKALQWISALEPIAKVEGWRIKLYTKSACGFASVAMEADCVAYNEALSERLASPEHAPDLIFTSMVRSGGQSLADSLVAHLQPAIDAGAEVVILGDNPAPNPKDMPSEEMTSYECVEANPDDYSVCSYASGTGSGTKALKLAAEELDAPFISMDRWVCPGAGPEPACPPVVGGVLLFRQGSHLTATYIRTLTPILHHELVRAGVATTPLDEIVWKVAQPGAATEQD
ncbi:acyltransferase family protein [Ornithinimicrobium tianjinense]|uniref:Acyltransferase n=1 Tax=Ornithinimicrobium tianjinense TaxID=1195761 RepID=A0A917BQ36_9MICO|nr:acyltransferase family protein [Ornithinimicrobium tianjinense]GGF52740.1 acyltransferase [Ornithinimicrobium tianjinense]